MEQEPRICEQCGKEILRRDGEYVSQYKRRRYCSTDCRKTGSASKRKATQEPSYATLHYRVYRARGRAADQICDHCGNPAKEWATVHNTDGLDPMTDYIPLCRKCHLAYDDVNYRKVATRRAQGGYVKTPAQIEAISQGFRRMWSKIPPEERSEIMRQRWEVSRAKKAALQETDLLPEQEADTLSHISTEGNEEGND